MKPAPTAGRISMTIRNLPKYIEIEVANDILRAQTMELVNRLRFMNSILEITNAVGGGGESFKILQIPYPFFMP
ncbi:bZIP transcription factor 53 [Glycine soja]